MKRSLCHWSFILSLFLGACGVVMLAWSINQKYNFNCDAPPYAMSLVFTLSPDKVDPDTFNKIKRATGNGMVVQDAVRTHRITESRWFFNKAESTQHNERTAVKTFAFLDQHHDKVVWFTIEYPIEE